GGQLRVIQPTGDVRPDKIVKGILRQQFEHFPELFVVDKAHHHMQLLSRDPSKLLHSQGQSRLIVRSIAERPWALANPLPPPLKAAQPAQGPEPPQHGMLRDLELPP